jgi:aminopeptidase N
LTSKLEPADARRIFPCWDEPAFKASFALSVRVPRHFVAVANMPVVREEPLEPNLKIVTFAPTPKMSTYLFVLTVGELERITAEADGVTIGVVATTGKAAQGKFALDSATKLLAWFNDYFGVKYPLPKLDLIAVPGGFGGAMENWGGITFFESRLLFAPATSPLDARRGIFNILRMRWRTRFSDGLSPRRGETTSGSRRLCELDAGEVAEDLHPDWRTWPSMAPAGRDGEDCAARPVRSSARSPTRPRQ